MPFRTLSLLLCVLASLSACATSQAEAPDVSETSGNHDSGGGGGGGYGGGY